MKALTFWETAAFHHTNAGRGDRWIVHGELCDHRRDLDHCGGIFDRYRRQSYHLGLAGCRAAKLAWRGRANANLQHRDGRPSRRHCTVASDAVN